MLIALASVKHAPGVTTTALGLASAWPNRTLLAECDPAGADIPSWLQLPAAGGLVDALLELRRSTADSTNMLWQQALSLETAGRLRLLSGVDDPVQAAAIESIWPLLAQRLTAMSHAPLEPVDVIMDCGRLTERGSPWPLLDAADIVGIVLRPTVAGVRLASSWLPQLRDRCGDDTRFGRRLRLVVIGDGPYPAGEVAEALDTPLLAALPADPGAARALAGGGGRTLMRSRLWRTLVQVSDDLARQQNTLNQSDPKSAETTAAEDFSAVPELPAGVA
jgi:Flp pilus assembly CpaE family ATPase